MSLSELRREFANATLLESQADPDPIRQFERWFQDVLAAELKEPNAMILATATRDGGPSARAVLLKGVDSQGFVFFTNYHSRKGRELDDNAQAALCFYWPELERQVRVTGPVTRVSSDESDSYFRSRPFESRVGAHVSEQSEVIAGREVLESRFAELQLRFREVDVPRPAHWGGFRVTPQVIEFWQGRPSRLHDRLCYTRQAGGGWRFQRLAP